MRWPWSSSPIPREARERARRQDRDIEVASQAARRAKAQLGSAEQLGREVESIVAHSHERVRRNHIREAFEETLARTVPTHRRRPL